MAAGKIMARKTARTGRAGQRVANKPAGSANGRNHAQLPEDPLTGPPRLDYLLAADPGDAGCDVAFHVLDRCAQAELNGTGPESQFPGVAAHLRRCRACHQDYQGLLAAVAKLRVQRVCEMTDLPTSPAPMRQVS